ncbi:MAG TPA: hypothetical protein VLM39_11645 [Ignavibacteriaceae bacterium]|nr:hypothetical protein [Ignavibacteriaceae bacterium]
MKTELNNRSSNKLFFTKMKKAIKVIISCSAAILVFTGLISFAQFNEDKFTKEYSGIPVATIVT